MCVCVYVFYIQIRVPICIAFQETLTFYAFNLSIQFQDRNMILYLFKNFSYEQTKIKEKMPHISYLKFEICATMFSCYVVGIHSFLFFVQYIKSTKESINVTNVYIHYIYSYSLNTSFSHLSAWFCVAFLFFVSFRLFIFLFVNIASRMVRRM